MKKRSEEKKELNRKEKRGRAERVGESGEF